MKVFSGFSGRHARPGGAPQVGQWTALAIGLVTGYALFEGETAAIF